MLPHALSCARFLARQFSRSRFNIAGAAPLALRSTMALWHRRLVLPPAGNFSPRKSSQNAPGAAAPGPPWGCAACIPRRGIARAVTLHWAVPSHTAHPFPASRGPVETAGHYGYRGFHSGRPLCLGMWQDAAHGSITTPQSRLCRDSSPYTGEPRRVQTDGFAHDFPIFAVEARIARPCREAASRGGCGGCARPFVPSAFVGADAYIGPNSLGPVRSAQALLRGGHTKPRAAQQNRGWKPPF